MWDDPELGETLSLSMNQERREGGVIVTKRTNIVIIMTIFNIMLLSGFHSSCVFRMFMDIIYLSFWRARVCVCATMVGMLLRYMYDDSDRLRW